MKKIKVTGAFVAAAVAGLMMTGKVMATDGHDHKAADGKVHCSGINECKGKSACKGADHACKGSNSCKGKGVIETTEADCKAKGGKVEK